MRVVVVSVAKSLSAFETTINCELTNVCIWLCANRSLLNIDKSNYVLFHPPQRNIQRFTVVFLLVLIIISLKESSVLNIWGS